MSDKYIDGAYWSSTNDLRFVRRTYTEPLPGQPEYGTTKSRLILQQLWVRQTIEKPMTEWKDVPEETE